MQTVTKQPRWVKLTNEYHNSEAKVLFGVLSKPTVARVRRVLCGYADCKCGETQLKTRGQQAVDIATLDDGRVQLMDWSNL